MSFSWLKHFHLRRITTGNRFIPEVDGFRFFAIFIVIGAHIYGQVPLPQTTGPVAHLIRYAFRDGKIGVYLFFTISGFILALPFARHHLAHGKPVNLQNYFRRRITRLEPPYIVAMVLRWPLVVLYKHILVTVAGIHLLASLLYLHSIAFNSYSIINPPAWSLEIEVQFYILAPLIGFIFMVRPTVFRQLTISAMIVATTILSLFIIPQTSRLNLTILGFAQYFLAGFLLCDIYVTENHPRLNRFVWDGIGVAIIGWLLFSPEHFYYQLFPFLTVMLYLAGLHGSALRRVFAYPAISITGGMCYSLYLTHTAVLTAVGVLSIKIQRLAHLSTAAHTATIFLIAYISIFLIGAAFYIILERPCMDPKWPQKLSSWLRSKA